MANPLAHWFSAKEVGKLLQPAQDLAQVAQGLIAALADENVEMGVQDTEGDSAM